jgi:hypothetical protein
MTLPLQFSKKALAPESTCTKHAFLGGRRVPLFISEIGQHSVASRMLYPNSVIAMHIAP